MKTGYLVRSLIVILLICMAGTIASAQLFNTSAMGLSSFGIPSNMMNTSLYGMPAYAMNPSTSPAMDFAAFTRDINNKYHPGAVGLNTTPVNAGTNTTSSWQMPAMPQVQFPTMGSSDILSQLIASPVTQNAGGRSPNATNNYTMASNNQTINMTVGDTIHVQLPASIDTGSIWNLTTTKGLNVTNQRMYPPKLGASTGSSNLLLTAVQEWDIKAEAPGVQKITGSCSGPDGKTYSLTVNVKG